MGWLDKLKDWAEDAVEDAVETVEQTVDDAGSWVEEKFQDLAGDNGWSGIVDRAGDLLGDKGDDLLQTVKETVGEHAQGTWAEDAWNTVKDAVGDGGGLLDQLGGGNVAEVLEKPAGTTFGEQAWNQVTDLFGTGTAAPASPLGPAAVTTTAQSLGQPVADTGDDILGRGIVPPHLDPAQQAPSIDAAVRPMAPEGDAATSGPATADAVSSPMVDTPESPATSGPAMPVEEPVAEPVMDAAPVDEPSQFDVSMAAADQVEASVDDLFADIG